MAQNATGNPKQHADHTDKLNKDVKDEIEHFPVNLPIREGAGGTAYPAEFYKKDPREEKLHLIRQLGKDWHNDGFTVALPEEVMDYFVQKKKYVEFENWEKWVQDNFDLSQPTEVERLKRIMPQYFERRLEYLKKLLGLTYTVHKLKLLGPEDEKDMMLMYELAKGEVPIPEIKLGLEGDEGRAFAKGFFNIRDWLGSEGNMKRAKTHGSLPWSDKTPNPWSGANVPSVFGTTLKRTGTNNPWKTLITDQKSYANAL